MWTCQGQGQFVHLRILLLLLVISSVGGLVHDLLHEIVMQALKSLREQLEGLLYQETTQAHVQWINTIRRNVHILGTSTAHIHTAAP